MLLEDKILIKAPASKLFAFFEQMDRNYTSWHPQHLCFEWRQGTGLQQGNRFYFEETIAGEHQKKEVVITSVEKNRYFEFAPVNRFFRLFLPKLSFAFAEQMGGTLFTANVVLRMGPAAAWLHRKELELVRTHMREEAENLKRLMEAPPLADDGNRARKAEVRTAYAER